jgi:hypothetical protein
VYLYLGAPEALGGRYSTPRGIRGAGAYDLRRAEEGTLIGAESVTATGDQVYSLEGGEFLFEFLLAQLRDFRFNYGGDWTRDGLTHDDYLAGKEPLLQVLRSWRWLE